MIYVKHEQKMIINQRTNLLFTFYVVFGNNNGLIRNE